MGCPLATMGEWAYFYLKQPKKYNETIEMIEKTEKMLEERGKKYLWKGIGAREFDKRIKEKWIKKIEEV